MRTYALKKAVITVLDHETLSVVSIDVQVKSDNKKKISANLVAQILMLTTYTSLHNTI